MSQAQYDTLQSVFIQEYYREHIILFLSCIVTFVLRSFEHIPLWYLVNFLVIYPCVNKLINRVTLLRAKHMITKKLHKKFKAHAINGLKICYKFIDYKSHQLCSVKWPITNYRTRVNNIGLGTFTLSMQRVI